MLNDRILCGTVIVNCLLITEGVMLYSLAKYN
jgi:hypothetical protein